MAKIDGNTLVSGLVKYLEWCEEVAQLEDEHCPNDGAAVLMASLYGDRATARKLIGGPNAPIFFDAAKEIERLRRNEQTTNT